MEKDPTLEDVQDSQHTHNAAEETEHNSEFTVKDKRFWTRSKDAEVPAEAIKKPSYIEELELKLQDKEDRLQNTLRQYKEALDEFETTKLRLRRDIHKEIEAGKRSILSELLEVMDNLQRAIDAATDDSKEPHPQTAALLSGVTMVRDLFLNKLQSFGVQKVTALGEIFDPSRFEAVSMVPVSDPQQESKVVGVVRDCYLIGDETLRHGMVAVGKQQKSA